MMRAKWKMPHPATMFLILTMAVVFLSWIFNVYDLSVLHPETGKEIYVQSLLSPEGIRWWLRHVVTNFTGFAPLGMVMIAMFGIGVAQHSGFIDACIRLVARRGTHSGLIITSVIVLGILSNVVGDAGYIILLPIAAALFHSAGLHPVGGIITAYVSVACGRNGMVAKADRPDGPFRVCNWSKESPKATTGVLAFDPAVMVDDDGRVYGYWGFEESWGAELDPATMATVKPGTQPVKDMVSSRKQDGVFRFFEASSIRKIKDKYVFVYSRWTAEGEFGFPGTNYTLAYAYSDNPLGPFTYGGTLIDGRGRDVDADGKSILTATPGGNTHGSIVEINGRWYVFYHRQCGTNEYARQAMVAPIEVKVTEGAGGKVEITEGEYTSEGFETDGLNPYKRYSAGIACYYTGPRPAHHEWPNFYFSGSYVQPTYGDATNFDDPYNLRVNSNPVVNNTAGSIVGYKYFNFDLLDPDKDAELLLSLKPLGVEGTIDVMVGSPWTSRGGVKVGTLRLSKDVPQQIAEMRISVSKAKEFKGKQALFFVFSSPTADRSLCELHNLVFVKR